jgi:transcriptional regulator with XRE-family HTH domain
MALNVPYFMQTTHSVLRGIGQRLRDRRIAADLTQGQLAKRADVSRQTVTRAEAGENIGLEPLVRLATALDAASEFNALFPPVDSRSLDDILTEQRKPQRVRHRANAGKANSA